MLSITTTELWPLKAREIIKSKKISKSYLLKNFHKVYFPWDSEYDKKRTYYSLSVQQRPLFIIIPNNVNQLELILNYIKEKELTIRMTVGRHSPQLLNPEVLLDLSLFKKIDKFDKIVTIGAGLTQGEINNYLFKTDNYYCHFGSSCRKYYHHPTETFSGGSAATVGCAGICTAGGIGILPRTYGLTIDSIISYDITIPPTKTVESLSLNVNENSNKKLFWGLKGGLANNFGIISSITLKLIKVPKLFKFTINWEWNINKAVQILDYWQKTSINRPNNFNEELSLFANSENIQISLGGYYIGIDSKDIEIEYSELIIKFSGTLSIDFIEYNHLYKDLVQNRNYYNFSSIQAFFINKFNSQKMIEFITKNKPLIGDFQSISFQLLGGVIRDVNTNSCAFYPREANFFVDTATSWNSQQSSQDRQKWVYDLDEYFLNKNSTMYVGFPLPFTDLIEKYGNHIYYQKHYKYLKKLKNITDPLNLLTPTGTI